MKSALIALFASCTILPLAGCATYGPGPGPVAYDGYYDDYYGPIYDGYWGDGDVFYYRGHNHGRYVADTGHHFRRDMGPGAGAAIAGPGAGRPGAGIPGGGPGGLGAGGGFHPMHGMGPGGAHGHGRR